MRNGLVYDLPLRLFHWIFAGFFVMAFVIAKTVDDESPTYVYHMLAGLMLGFTVLLRIIWGLFGTKHARFSGLALDPRDVFSYFLGIVKGEKRKWAGHNPASSWVALVMFFLALGLGVTGYLMTTGQKEAFEDIHEVFANTFLVVVLMHVAGVIVHSLRYRDMIALSMVDGKKSEVSPSEVISSSRPVIAVLFIVLLAGFANYLARNFDQQKQTLHAFGAVLQLGEGGEQNQGSEHEEED